jgi:hypothetical protein
MNQACLLITAPRRDKRFLGYTKHSTTGLSTIGRQVAFSDQMYMVESAETCVEIVNREVVYIFRRNQKPWFRQATSNGEHEVFSHLRNREPIAIFVDILDI